MNLTTLFISTSTSWHVTLTNKNITSTKIILGNEPIGIVTKGYFYIKESEMEQRLGSFWLWFIFPKGRSREGFVNTLQYGGNISLLP